MGRFYFTNKNIKKSFLLKKKDFLINKNTNNVDEHILILTNKKLHNNYNILFDGNIVNNIELSELLNSSTDNINELLLELYKNFGKDMLLKLNGSFSFIIYDSDKKIIFGARDRLGEKPFFYYINEIGIECSSCLRSICVNNKFEINEIAKDMYVNYGFIYDSSCIFKEVNKLQAGHYFIYDLKTNVIKTEKYWDIDGTGFKKYPRFTNEEDIIDYIDKLLESSIKLRIENLDKFGVAISSGTDGFTLFSYLNQMGKNIPLFNIISSKKTQFNEYPDALLHVQELDKNKQINAKYLDEKDLFNGIENYFKYYEEPNSDLSEIITDALFSYMAENGIYKELSGIGSDDIFFAKPLYMKYMNNITQYTNSYIDFSKYCNNKNEIKDFSNILDNNDLLSLQRYNIKTYLPNLLVKEDIASTHNGVEVINPFCDYRLVEFLNILDIDVLYKNKQLKYILKYLILNKFGVNFFNNDKKGFFPDIGIIYKINDIKKDIISYLTKENINKFFPEINYNFIKIYIEQYDVYYKDRTLLNLYFYIKMMIDYEKIFNYK